MNLQDLNKTQEAGKVHTGLVLLFFFVFQKFGSVQMDSICTPYDSLPAGSFGKARGNIHVIPAQQHWFDVVRPQQLKIGLFGNGFYHQAPTNPGLCQHHQPKTWGSREQAPAPTQSNNHIPAAHVWVWKTPFKSKKR